MTAGASYYFSVYTDFHPALNIKVSYLESGYFVRVAKLLVYMCPPTSMCTGALALVSWAGRGMPCAARGDTGERVRERRDMLLPSCGSAHTTPSQESTSTTHTHLQHCFSKSALSLLIHEHKCMLQACQHLWDHSYIHLILHFAQELVAHL